MGCRCLGENTVMGMEELSLDPGRVDGKARVIGGVVIWSREVDRPIGRGRR